VSKYSKSGSNSNLHENSSIFAGRRTPLSGEKKSDGDGEDGEEPDDHHLEPLGASEDDIDEFIKKHMGEEEAKIAASKGKQTEEQKA